MLNKGMAREVREVQVYCSNVNRGCDWVGEVVKLEEHVSPGTVDNSRRLCQFEMVVCSNGGCNEEVMRRDLAKHQSELCPHRIFECNFCESFHSTFDDLNNHYSTCPAYPVDCPNGCGEQSIPRLMLTEHLEKCPLSLMDCDFKSVGCEFRRRKDKMSGHLQVSANYHMKLICQAVTLNVERFDQLDREVESLSSQVATLQEENKKSREENSELRNMNNQLHSDIQSMKGLVMQMNERLNQEQLRRNSEENGVQGVKERKRAEVERQELAEQIAKMKAEREHMKKSFAAELAQLKREAENREATVKILLNEIDSQKNDVKRLREDAEEIYHETKLESLKTSIGDDVNTRIVKLEDNIRDMVKGTRAELDQKLKEVKEGLSKNVNDEIKKIDGDLQYVEKWITPRPPFAFTVSRFQERKSHKEAFVSPSFYHNLRGYKMCVRVDVYGMNNHVAVFCCIMRGEHDHLLPWPFCGAIKIRLQNHLDDRNHFEKDIRYDVHTDVKKSGRVKTGDKNYLHGHPQFIAHSKLAFDADRNCQYLKGDALDFEVVEVQLLK